MKRLDDSTLEVIAETICGDWAAQQSTSTASVCPSRKLTIDAAPIRRDDAMPRPVHRVRGDGPRRQTARAL